jgi:hypothetical protein
MSQQVRGNSLMWGVDRSAATTAIGVRDRRQIVWTNTPFRGVPAFYGALHRLR